MNNKLDILNSIKFSTENNLIPDDVDGYCDGLSLIHFDYDDDDDENFFDIYLKS